MAAVPLYRAMLDGSIDPENDPLAQPLLLGEEGYDRPSFDPLWQPTDASVREEYSISHWKNQEKEENRKLLRKSQRRVSFSDDTEEWRERSDHVLRQRKAMSRLLDRDPSSAQSRSFWNTQLISKDQAHLSDRTDRPCKSSNQNVRFPSEYPIPQGDRYWYASLWNTWFYTLAYQRTVILIVILFLSYFALVLFFAFLYFSASRIGASIENDDPKHTNGAAAGLLTHNRVNATYSIPSFIVCDMDLHEPMEAMYFSLSTMASIGYGVSDYYFGKCFVPFLLVLMQICTAICFDAIAIGLLFQRIRRSHKRSKTIIFTNGAVVQRIRRVPYLMIRIAELRRYPLLNATVRAYCVRHERNPMATQSLSDDLVEKTPLMDMEDGRPTDAVQMETIYFVTKPMTLQTEHVLMNIPQVIVHEINSDSPLYPPSVWYDKHGNQNSYPPASLSDESFGTRPVVSEDHRADTEEIQKFVQDRNIEVIVVVEGTDELTGTCTQTKQSYTYTDLHWNAKFVPCIFPNRVAAEPTCVIDFSLFHAVAAAPENSEVCPYVQN